MTSKEVSNTLKLGTVTLSLSTIILIFNILQQLYISALILSGFILISSIILRAIVLGYVKYSKIGIVLLVNTHLLLSGYAEGLRIGGYLFFFPLFFSIPYLVEPKKTFTLEVALLSLITIICFCSCLFFGFEKSIWQTIPEPVYETNFFINTISAVLLSSAISYVSIRSERESSNALREQRNAAEALNLKLQIQSDELLSKSAELELQAKNLQELNIQLEKEREKSDLANHAKSQFLATMSHEIRTPMNGVIGMASLLSETSLEQEQIEYLDSIRSSGNALMSVINDVLDFSKIESDGMVLEQHSFNLRQNIEEVIDLFALKVDEQELELLYRLAPDIPEYIIGDSHRLRQVLLNLVSNAIKFTERGEVVLTVKLKRTLADDIVLEFEVTDTGIGIPEDKISKLFNAFTQVDSSTTRKYGGTGLGLVISERLIKLMGGSINVKSEFGKGTIFSFTVACKAKEDLKNQDLMDIRPDGDLKKVLLIDENSKSADIFQSYIEECSLQVLKAESGTEALSLLGEISDIQLVILNANITDIPQEELSNRIASQSPELSVILLTSVNKAGIARQSPYYSSVLAKPVKKITLLNHVLSAFNRKVALPEKEDRTAFLLSDNFAIKYPMDILLAEDNIINQKLALRVLGKLGYNPVLANNGKEAVQKLLEHDYHIVLMDVLMPEMDGLEATRYIRRYHEHQPAIIAMTANALPDDKSVCLQAGMNDYITKPIDLKVLVNILKETALKLQV